MRGRAASSMAEVRAKLPSARPATVEQALSLMKIRYHDSYKGESKHATGALQLTALCPLHNDRKESFSVRSDDGTWYCHKCGEGGPFVRLVERVCGVPPFMAERWVQGIDSASVPRKPRVLVAYDKDGFRDEFTRPPGWALEERGISREAASALSIRWYQDCSAWVLPVWFPDGSSLLGWQFKNAGSTWCHEGTPKSLTLFGIDRFKTGSTAILVESPLDVAVLLTAGIEGGLASFGANVSHAQLQLLADRARRVFIALDNDKAGWDSYGKVIKAPELASKQLFEFNYDATPKAKDPGEMEDGEIREAIRTAKRVRR